MNARQIMFSACVAFASFGAAAQWAPTGAFVQGGAIQEGGYSLTGGVQWPWSWRHAYGDGAQWTGYTEASLAAIRPHRLAGQPSTFVQLALVPVLRYRFAGNSPWFAEAGIGLSYTNRLYVTADKAFSTRFNFSDAVGLGYSFGATQSQDVTVRVNHFSNAGIKHPNPGENFVQLRYTTRF